MSTTVLIDSWAWIEYWKGGKNRDKTLPCIEGDEEAYVSSISITEICAWFLRHYDEATVKERVETIESRCHIISIDKVIAVAAASLKHKHRLGTADSIILATSRLINSELLTGDPDLKGITGVRYIGE